MKNNFIYCEACSYKGQVDIDDVSLLRRSDIQNRVPGLEEEKDELNKRKNPQTKCPRCGRGVLVKKIPDVYQKTIELQNNKQKTEQQKKDFEQRIKDGKPEQKVDFIG